MGMTSRDHEFAVAWQANRTYLVDLAFRMLGSIGDAEDVVQEAFSRLADTDITQLVDVRGWLTVVTSRISLDLLRSARSRHELPGDPLELDSLGLARRPVPADPADRITLDDDVQLALLVVLQRLKPAERVAFILHDVFAMPFEMIAETLGRPIGTCRQLARRARHKLAGAQPGADMVHEHRMVTEQFIAACAGGDLDRLLTILHPDVWGAATFLSGTMDTQINRGRTKVAVSLGKYYADRATLVSHAVLDKPAVLAFIDRKLFALLVLTVQDDMVAQIEATVF